MTEFERLIGDNTERVCLVHTRAQLDDPRLRLLLSMEGVEPLDGDPGAFDEWYGRGVRSASLTWNHANEFAGGIDTPGQGLGRQRPRYRPPLGRTERHRRPYPHVPADLARRGRRRGTVLSDARRVPRRP